MLPLAHIGFAMLFASLLYLPLSAAVLGALIPDVIDKILFAAGAAPCGRFVAHTLFFGPLMALAAFAVTRRKDVALAVLVGTYVHLALDTNYFIPWLYPLVNYSFACEPTVVRPDILNMSFETAGALLIPIALALKPRLKSLRNIFAKLPRNLQRLNKNNPR